MMRPLIMSLALIAALYGSCHAQAPSDSDLFAEGRSALETHKDCPRAKQAFDLESAVAKESPIWLEYAARTAECLGDLDAAVALYDKELARLPGTPRLIDKVGDLRYQVRLRADRLAQQTAQQIAQQAAQEQERNLQVQADRGNLAANSAKLVEQLETPVTGLTRSKVRIDRCVLSYHEEYKAERSKRDVSIDLAGAAATCCSERNVSEHTIVGISVSAKNTNAVIEVPYSVRLHGILEHPLVSFDSGYVVALINALSNACRD